MHGMFIGWMEKSFSAPPDNTGHAAFRGEDKKHLFIYRGFFGSKAWENGYFSNFTQRNTK